VPSGGRAHAHPHDPPVSMMLPLWVLAVLSLGIGLYFTFAAHADPGFEAPAWLMPVAIGVAVAGIGLAWLTYQRRTIDAERLASTFGPIRHAAIRRFWIDDVFAALYQRLLLGFSAVVGWIDRYLVDGVLNVLSAWTVDAGDDLRRLQTGRAQDYVYGIAVGLLVLILWMGIA
jgi:NADH-quinone oxidoreductase subunit L